MKYSLFLFMSLLIFTQCKEPCDEVDCGPNGTCVFGECDCNPGWSGDNCDSADLCLSSMCLNGECDPITDNCLCESGFNGKNCECDKTLRAQDSLNLVEIFKSLSGLATLWDLDQPMDEWEGIELTDCGQVESIYFLGLGLTGSLPPLEFPELFWLDLHLNNLNGEIPALDKLPKLEYFNCRENFLEGEIQPLDKVPLLEEFDVSYNFIEGEIPPLSLPNLRVFNCQNNQIESAIPSLMNLPELQYFDCGNNELIGEIPSFENLPKIISFSCYRNGLTGVLPSLDNINSIKEFSCSGNQLTGEIPPLDVALSLREFYCWGNNLNGCLPAKSCMLLSFQAENNPLLPWQGEKTQFCNGESQVGAPCIKDGIQGNIDSNCNCIT